MANSREKRARGFRSRISYVSQGRKKSLSTGSTHREAGRLCRLERVLEEAVQRAKTRLLAAWPLLRLADWVEETDRPQTEAELAALRRSVNRGCLFGVSWSNGGSRQVGTAKHSSASRSPQNVNQRRFLKPFHHLNNHGTLNASCSPWLRPGQQVLKRAPRWSFHDRHGRAKTTAAGLAE